MKLQQVKLIETLAVLASFSLGLSIMVFFNSIFGAIGAILIAVSFMVILLMYFTDLEVSQEQGSKKQEQPKKKR